MPSRNLRHTTLIGGILAIAMSAGTGCASHSAPGLKCLERNGKALYYLGPIIDVTPSAAELDMALKAANFTNLTPIDPSAFEQ